MSIKFNYLVVLITFLVAPWNLIKAQELYLSANYHQHDEKRIEKYKSDIALMKAGGFKVVQMGHWAWDSYEPSDGKFDFKWADQVMDLMQEAGIKVDWEGILNRKYDEWKKFYN